MSLKTGVILGGGTGGIICANKLAYKLRKKHKIILVEKNSQHTFAPFYSLLLKIGSKFLRVPINV